MPDIKFYYPNDPYGEFSNFYVRPIDIEGVIWPTTEHFFQAMKSDDPDVQEHVRTKLPRPGQAKNWCSPGGAGNVKLREGWDGSVIGLSPQALALFTDEQGLVVDRLKDHIMYQALIAKFTQHADLAKTLLDTGDAFLIEDTQKVGIDPYWGNGPAGNGLNKLGRMLMLVRKALPRHLGSASLPLNTLELHDTPDLAR